MFCRSMFRHRLALTTAETLWSFGSSECNKVNIMKHVLKQMVPLPNFGRTIYSIKES